ncbi:MAG: hypothetical protein AAF663_00750 [Planctomycetota bacterium]
MANPEPIQLEIRGDYDGKPVEDAARDLNKLGQENQQVADAQRGHANESRQLRDELRSLLIEQNRAAKQTDASEKQTEQAAQAESDRRQRIDELSLSLARLEQEQEEVNAEMQRSVDRHRDSRQSAGLLSGAFGRLGDVVTKLIPGIGALALAQQSSQAAMRIHAETIEAANTRLERHIQLTTEAAKATLDLHALSFEFSEADEQFITQQQEISGRGRGEIAQSFISFKSATSGRLSPEEQRRTFEDLVTVPGLGTGGGIEGQAEFAARASGVVDDPVELRNLAALANRAAGEGNREAFLQAAAELLPTAQGLGVDPADTLSLLSVGTGVYGAPEAKTKVEQLMLRLLADPEVAKQLAEVGADTEGDIFQRIASLEGVDQGQLSKIANTENIGLLNALIARPDELAKARRELNTYDDQGVDIYSDFLNDLYSQNPRARFVQIAQQQAASLTARGETNEDAAYTGAVRSTVENILDELVQNGRLDERSKNNRLERFDELVALGQAPLDAAEYIEAPGRVVRGRGIISGTSLTLGTSSFQGIRQETARRLAVGVRGPEGQSFGGLPGASGFEQVPILSEGGGQLRDASGTQINADVFAMLERRMESLEVAIRDSRVDPNDIGEAVGSRIPAAPSAGPSYLEGEQSTSSVVDD